LIYIKISNFGHYATEVLDNLKHRGGQVKHYRKGIGKKLIVLINNFYFQSIKSRNSCICLSLSILVVW